MQMRLLYQYSLYHWLNCLLMSFYPKKRLIRWSKKHRIDRRINLRTDTTSYRNAWSHLKTHFFSYDMFSCYWNCNKKKTNEPLHESALSLDTKIPSSPFFRLSRIWNRPLGLFIGHWKCFFILIVHKSHCRWPYLASNYSIFSMLALNYS